jgi:osmotically-inducible protein OsmY
MTKTLIANALELGGAGDRVLLPEREHEARTLAAIIHRSIRKATNDGIDRLTVEVEDHQVQLDGYCHTFYAKQKAQQAAMEIFSDGQVNNEIQVA